MLLIELLPPPPPHPRCQPPPPTSLSDALRQAAEEYLAQDKVFAEFKKKYDFSKKTVTRTGAARIACESREKGRAVHGMGSSHQDHSRCLLISRTDRPRPADFEVDFVTYYNRLVDFAAFDPFAYCFPLEMNLKV